MMPQFTLFEFVLYCHQKGIEEQFNGRSKIKAMFFSIGKRFVSIPFKVYSLRMKFYIHDILRFRIDDVNTLYSSTMIVVNK